MGLSVRVYQNIKLANNNEDYDFEAYVIDKEWEFKIKNLEKGSVYTGKIVNRSISYSYSAHSRFRETLIKLIGRNDLLKSNNEIDWEKLSKDIPFYDFINFADNEGVLDWEISDKIHNDFEKYKAKAIDFYSELEINRYLEWLKVFKLAKNKGVVVFS